MSRARRSSSSFRLSDRSPMVCGVKVFRATCIVMVLNPSRNPSDLRLRTEARAAARQSSPLWS